MKTITIHGVSEEMEKLIRERAKKEDRSVNKVVKDLLGSALGLEEKVNDYRADFADLFGIWSDEEAASFLDSLDDFEQIDEGDWR
jgi:plasmid stability protein